jgi:Transcriptional regulators
MDTLDRKIISHLRDDARANYQDIGHNIGLSPSAVKRRVDKLRQDGTIRRFTVDVDPAVDGLGVSAYVELHCRGTVSPNELKRLLDSVPAVVGAGTVSGEADAMSHARSKP